MDATPVRRPDYLNGLRSSRQTDSPKLIYPGGVWK